MRQDIRSLLHPFRIAPARKLRVYTQIHEKAEKAHANYWGNIILSAGIATLGLVLNSPAVIIGAMLISPLMDPIMATGLALAIGDIYLLVRSLTRLISSIGVAVLLSALVVWLLPFHSTTAEVVARTNPNLLDLGIALLSGLAGSIALCGMDGLAAMPGVAIAVALMPPLCTVGFGLGYGPNGRVMSGAGLLFLTNLVAIIASAFAVFLLAGMNSSEVLEAMARSRGQEALTEKIGDGPLARIIASSAKLRWRILVLFVLLAAIAVPLRRALMQLASEAVARTAIQDELKQLIPRGSLVSQQVDVGRDAILLQLVLTKPVSAKAIREAQRNIEMRSGRRAELNVSSVASQSEFEELMQKVAATPPSQPLAPPAPRSLADIQGDLNGRLAEAIQGLWPGEAPMQSSSIEFNADGIVVHVVYDAKKDLDPVALGILQQQLESRLKATGLKLSAERKTSSQGDGRPARRKR